MTKVMAKMTGLFMAATIFLSPLLALADASCRCPDCARRACVVKSRICSCKDCEDTGHSRCSPDDRSCQTCKVPANAGQDADASHPEHPSRPESEGCHCNGYIYGHGSAVLPVGEANASSCPVEFYQQIPATLITSGWVYQILHPPRSLAA